MQPSVDQLARMAGGTINVENARAVLAGIAAFPLIRAPHRLAHYLAQLMHETADFRYDVEVWGPTPAQRRYEGRLDLGNTAPGDGYRFRGRTGIQVTGRTNYAAFRDWCRVTIDPKAPDFETDPDATLTDPWEGLAPLWYWSTRNLNHYADANNIEMVTRRINGGLNGYADRLARYTRCGLVLLGYGPADVRQFQTAEGLTTDGVAGPATRSAIHAALQAGIRIDTRALPGRYTLTVNQDGSFSMESAV